MVIGGGIRMPDRAIIFDDGTIIEGKAGYAEGFLWCRSIRSEIGRAHV